MHPISTQKLLNINPPNLTQYIRSRPQMCILQGVGPHNPKFFTSTISIIHLYDHFLHYTLITHHRYLMGGVRGPLSGICSLLRVVLVSSRDLRSFVIRFNFESYVRFEICIRIDGPIRNFRTSNRPCCQSSFVKKQLVVVEFAFNVDFGSKISVQQHCLKGVL